MQDAIAPILAHQPAEQFEAGGVRPVHILEDHQNRRGTGRMFTCRTSASIVLLSALARGQFERGIAPIVWQREHLGEQRGVLGRYRSLSQERIELVELALQRVVARKAGGALHSWAVTGGSGLLVCWGEQK